MLRLHNAIFRSILRECANEIPLVMPENVHLVQTDELSHTAETHCRVKYHAISLTHYRKKVQNSELFYNNAITQSLKIARKNA